MGSEMRQKQTWHLRFLFPARMEGESGVHDWPAGCFSASRGHIVFEVLSCWMQISLRVEASLSITFSKLLSKTVKTHVFPSPPPSTDLLCCLLWPQKPKLWGPNQAFPGWCPGIVLSSKELHNRNAGLI